MQTGSSGTLIGWKWMNEWMNEPFIGFSYTGNLVKPLLSLYGTEWRERGYGLWVVMAMAERSFNLGFVFDSKRNQPAYSRSKRSEPCLYHKFERSKRSELCLFNKLEVCYSTNSKDRSGANSVYSTKWKDWSEAKSVYSTNLKDRSGANSAYTRNRQDRSEKKELDRSKTNRGGLFKTFMEPRNRFQGIDSASLFPGGPVQQPYSSSVPSPLKLF